MVNQKKYIFLLLILQFSSSLFSQQVFRDGYIEKKSGESFSGLVAFNPDKKIPDNCIFKRFDIAYELKYNPSQLKAFGYKNGKRYESLEMGGDVAFYEILVKGDISVFNKGAKYYIRKNGQSPFEVKNGRNSVTIDGKQHEFDSLSELLKFLTSASTIKVEDNINLKDDLVPLVLAYNKTSGNSWNVYNRSFSEKELSLQAWRSGSNQSRFGILGGVNNYILKVKPTRSQIYLPDPEKETSIMLGISYERVLSKKTDKMVLRADLIYLQQDFYNYSETQLYSTMLSRDDAFYKFSAIKMPVLLQYYFTGSRIKPYLNGGLSGMIFLNKEYSHISEVEIFGKDIRTYEDSDMIFNFGELSATIGAGLKIRIINKTILNIEGRFEFGTGAFNNKYPEDGAFSQYSMQPSILFGITF